MSAKNVEEEGLSVAGPIGAVCPVMKKSVVDAVLDVANRIESGETVGVAIVEVSIANDVMATEGRLAKNVRQTLCYGLDKLKFRIHMDNEFNADLLGS